MSNAMISIDQFAELHKASTRTVRRWLADGRIPGAVMDGKKWMLPAEAIVQDTLPGVMVARDSGRDVAVQQRGHGNDTSMTVAGVLAPLPVMVTLDVASRVLGISEYAIRQHAEYFELQRMGERGAYVMPKARIRELEG